MKIYKKITSYEFQIENMINQIFKSKNDKINTFSYEGNIALETPLVAIREIEQSYGGRSSLLSARRPNSYV